MLDHYPATVEEFADAMAVGRPVTLTGQAPGAVLIPGEPLPVRDAYQSLLGCFASTAHPAFPGEGSLSDAVREGRLAPPPG